MIHLLKNKQGQFYWIAVVKKKRGYEKVAISPTSYPSKSACRTKLSEFMTMLSGEDSSVLLDHAVKGSLFYDRTTAEQAGEINFVRKIRKGKMILPS